ncbi:MAG: tyrosine-type recombinase/integrase [Planctomycetia bacterium]
MKLDGRKVWSCAVVERAEAVGLGHRMDDSLRRLANGLLQPPPPPIDPAAWLISDGRSTVEKPAPAAPSKSLGDLLDLWADATKNLEATTQTTRRVHDKRLRELLGAARPLAAIDNATLQTYVDDRSAMTWRGRRIGRATIEKELATLGAAWRHAARKKFHPHPWPGGGLRFPRGREKPPYATRAEIERRVKAGISDAEATELWKALFLTASEVVDLVTTVAALDDVPPWLPAAVAVAAYSGARRSELARLEWGHIDFDGPSPTVTLTEKKRRADQTTTRRVPLAAPAARHLKAWRERHPGGAAVFRFAEVVYSSKRKKGSAAADATCDEFAHHLRQTLDRTPWNVVSGWHVLRHSFISNCAAAGVDQRLIDSWVGHSTEEQRRRYRHLIPARAASELDRVFGGD